MQSIDNDPELNIERIRGGFRECRASMKALPSHGARDGPRDQKELEEMRFAEEGKSPYDATISPVNSVVGV